MLLPKTLNGHKRSEFCAIKTPCYIKEWYKMYIQFPFLPRASTATMKSISLLSFLLPTISAHAIFQRVSVNGVDQGLLNGVRSPSSNYPLQNVQSQDIACNVGLQSPVSTSIIQIPGGSKVGAYWQHLIGGPQGSNDPDNPIAASHKGPIVVYLAKVCCPSNSLNTFNILGIQFWHRFRIRSIVVQDCRRRLQYSNFKMGCRYNACWKWMVVFHVAIMYCPRSIFDAC